jgi:hypothetical protein
LIGVSVLHARRSAPGPSPGLRAVRRGKSSRHFASEGRSFRCAPRLRGRRPPATHWPRSPGRRWACRTAGPVRRLGRHGTGRCRNGWPNRRCQSGTARCSCRGENHLRHTAGGAAQDGACRQLRFGAHAALAVGADDELPDSVAGIRISVGVGLKPLVPMIVPAHHDAHAGVVPVLPDRPHVSAAAIGSTRSEARCRHEGQRAGGSVIRQIVL